MSSAEILALRRRIDERAGGMTPVVVEAPTVGLVMPRVAADGSLRSVAFVNARIDVQKPVRIRLRGVPQKAASAIWRAFHEEPVALPLERSGADVVVAIPALSAWNCGWLEI